MKTKMVNVSDLVLTDFNPAGRITHVALWELEKSIKENGYFQYKPIIINHQNIVCDGHRRVTVAKKLGILRLPAFVVNGEPSDVWAQANSGVRPIGSREIYQAVAAGLQRIPATRQGYAVQKVIDEYGLDMVKYCAEHGVSKSVFDWARNLSVYLNRENDHEYKKKISYWLIDNRYIRKIRMAMELEVAPEKIIAAIENNRPIEI